MQLSAERVRGGCVRKAHPENMGTLLCVHATLRLHRL